LSRFYQPSEIALSNNPYVKTVADEFLDSSVLRTLLVACEATNVLVSDHEESGPAARAFFDSAACRSCQIGRHPSRWDCRSLAELRIGGVPRL
jgi:hypothetical protein